MINLKLAPFVTAKAEDAQKWEQGFADMRNDMQRSLIKLCKELEEHVAISEGFESRDAFLKECTPLRMQRIADRWELLIESRVEGLQVVVRGTVKLRDGEVKT